MEMMRPLARLIEGSRGGAKWCSINRAEPGRSLCFSAAAAVSSSGPPRITFGSTKSRCPRRALLPIVRPVKSHFRNTSVYPRLGQRQRYPLQCGTRHHLSWAKITSRITSYVSTSAARRLHKPSLLVNIGLPDSLSFLVPKRAVLAIDRGEPRQGVRQGSGCRSESAPTSSPAYATTIFCRRAKPDQHARDICGVRYRPTGPTGRQPFLA
jgi:hypothetical protein